MQTKEETKAIQERLDKFRKETGKPYPTTYEEALKVYSNGKTTESK